MCFYRYKLLFCVVIVITSVLFSCTNNKTLETFQLGQERSLKVTTGWADNYLPIYYETYLNGELKQKCYLFSESPEYEAINKFRFKVFGDKSNQVFVLMLQQPETDALAIFDYSTGFKYPCCSNDHGIECKTKYNQLAEILERDNPGLKVKRKEIP